MVAGARGMASAFSHAFAAVALVGGIAPRRDWRFWVLAAGSAALPDADVLGFAVGIPYESIWGHRGFTHSLVFAALWAGLVLFWEFRNTPRFTPSWWRIWTFFFLVTASHGVLDALTNGGLGVGFFAPFSATRYFFPWTPIEVSPIGLRSFFSETGMRVISNEVVSVWLPLAGFWLLASLVRLLWGRFRKA